MNLYLAIILFNLSDKKIYNNKKELSLEAKLDAKLGNVNSEVISSKEAKIQNVDDLQIPHSPSLAIMPGQKRTTVTQLRRKGMFTFSTAVLALTKKLPNIDYFEEEDYESPLHSSDEVLI